MLSPVDFERQQSQKAEGVYKTRGYSDWPVGCQDRIEIEEPISPKAQLPEFPKLGRQNDKTAIGNGLEAILDGTSRPNSLCYAIAVGGGFGSGWRFRCDSCLRLIS